MDDMNQQSSGLMQATPTSMVPPGSAIPVQTTGNGQRATGLPKKVVTLETIEERVDGQRATGNGVRLDQRDTPTTPRSEVQISPSQQEIISNHESRITNNNSSSVLPESQSQVPNDDSFPVSSPQSLVSDSDEDEEPLELPDLTPEQISFLSSERYREASAMIKREFGMEDEDLIFLSEMEHAVLGGVIDLEQFVIALKGEFPRLNEAEKSRLIGILLAYRFEPFADQLKPTPTEAARKQDIKLAQAPYYHIYTKPLTFRGAAHEVARMAGVELMGQAQERLRDAIVSRMKGIRTDGQIQELFMRPPEQAGLGLTEEKARMAREALVELIGRARLLNEDEYAQWLNDQIHHKKAPDAALPQDTANAGTTLHAEEEKEIAEIAQRMPEMRARAEEETVLSRAVSMVVRGLSWRPTDDYLLRRLENTISTRLRDVRSRNEVFIKLIRDDKVGGLGLDRKQAEKISEEIEKGYQSYRGAVAEEEKQKVKEQIVDQERKVGERKRREAEEHAKWFEEKVKGRQDSSKGGLELLKVIARGQTTPVHPLDAKEEVRERESFGNLVEATKSGSLQDKASAMHQLAEAFKEGRGRGPKQGPATKASAPSAPPPKAPPVVKVSVETARMAQQSVGATKPKMQDVTPIRVPVAASSMALSGPMQEIGHMTLENFRRLSSDPKAAAKRVMDLADVLGQESYERRLAAVEAWKSCPLQKMYLDLVAAAFLNKKSVNDIATANLAAGKLAPTPEEIAMIVELNRKLSL